MRVAIVGNANSEHITHWADAIVQLGHECVIYGPHTTGGDERLVPVGTPGLGGPRGLAARVVDLRRRIRQFQPDVLHGHYALDYGTWAVLSGFRPVIVSAWTDLLLGPSESRLERWKVRLALKRADAVTANSAVLLDRAVQLGTDPGKLHRIVFGVDTERYRPGPANQGERPPTLLSSRQLKPLYHISDIIRAGGLLREQDVSFELTVASFGPEAESLKSLARACGIEESTVFTGRLTDEELLGLYMSSDVYVSVPESDSISVSLLEAMSCALPVVASDLPPNREWLGQSGEGGLLVPVGDVQALAESLARLAADPGLSDRMGERNRAKVQRDAEWSTEVDKMIALYERLVAEART